MSVEQEFFERLERIAPELRAVRREHESDHGGELLGHLLIADVLRWACASVETEPAAVDAVLAEMAHSFQPNDDPVSNMISLSFLENLGFGNPREVEIRRRLPLKLAEELARMDAWPPRSAPPPPNAR